MLDKFIVHMENCYFKAVDVALTNHFCVPAEYIEAQFRRFHRFPMRQRYAPMTDYILEMAHIRYGITATTSQKNILKKSIRNMFAGNNDLQVYRDFFQWMGKPQLFVLQKKRTLEYADLAPLAYLHIALDGFSASGCVKHLVIDEMQDYSPIQYKVLQKLFACRKTVLGDAGQAVNPYGASTAEMIQHTMASGDIMKLCKSYRSTVEITQFAQKIRFNPDLEVVSRHGEVPKILMVSMAEEEINSISNLICMHKTSGYTSLGIICKTALQSREICQKLVVNHSKNGSAAPDIHLVTANSAAFAKGIVVTCALMAKGLEFDEVIIPQADTHNYHSEPDRATLYVAVTRAMHRLTLTCVGTVTPLIDCRFAKTA